MSHTNSGSAFFFFSLSKSILMYHNRNLLSAVRIDLGFFQMEMLHPS